MAIARRAWPVVALVACAVVFAWRVHDTVVEAEFGSGWIFTRGPVLFLGVTVAVLAVGVVVARLLWPRARHVPAWRAGAVTAAVALVASTPAGIYYRDGCNFHDTRSSLALLPALAIARPVETDLTYTGSVTAMACPVASAPPRA
jgi:hypothetical protein